MPSVALDTATRLYYEDEGDGRPVVCLHGVWCSSRFFRPQVPALSARYRLIVPDLRGYGRSERTAAGHTVAQHARDIRALIARLGLRDVVLLGHSMGAFVAWDYVRQFGTDGLAATIVVDQTASDYMWPDWAHGAFDFASLCQVMARVQDDWPGMAETFIATWLTRHPLPAPLTAALLEDVRAMSPTIASAILFDQTVQDYRPVLAAVTVPTLLCFGEGGAMTPAAAAYLRRHLPDARVELFAQSNHSPHLEEPDRFNAVVDEFLRTLG
jgi:pimeloyl-ACP methyl ester carboxylesterase